MQVVELNIEDNKYLLVRNNESFDEKMSELIGKYNVGDYESYQEIEDFIFDNFEEFELYDRIVL